MSDFSITHKSGSQYTFSVDDCDNDLISDNCFVKMLNGKPYLVKPLPLPDKAMFIHKAILERSTEMCFSRKEKIIHINGDTTNNTRGNLESCHQSSYKHIETSIHSFTPEDVQRFWAKVSILDDESCWDWRVRKNEGTYGTIKWDGGKSELAHRVSYAITYGYFDTNLCVLHHCDNPSCVNPNHLFLGDNMANVMDRVSKGRNGDIGGEKHPCHKLTEQGVKDIRRKFATAPKKYGMKTKLAREYHVSDTVIHNAITYKTWKEVT